MARLQRDILVMACKRSGHHAVMGWMLHGMPEPKYRINHVGAQNAIPATKEVRKGLGPIMKKVNSKDTFCVMYNVEQADLKPWSKWKLYKQRSRALGVKGEVVRKDAILVVRDPFNCIASAMKSSVVTDARSMIPLLKMHYRQALGDERHADCHVINFNRWFSDPGYRRLVAEQLDMPWVKPERRHASVPPSANGSSFDRRKFHGRGFEMKVLDRWRQVKEDHLGKLVDPELRKLSERLFGFNPLA